MGFFGKKEFILGEGAYNVINRCSDAKGGVDPSQLREAAERAERDLYDPRYAANRTVHEAGMRDYARELRAVLTYIEENPSRVFTIRRR